RRKDYLLPRLIIAVIAGFLVLSASSWLTEILWRASSKPGWSVVLPAASVIVVCPLACTAVRKQVGPLQGIVVLSRGLAIMLYAGVYAAAGGAVQYMFGPELKFQTPLPFVVLCASMALLITFVLQPFWQLADPL